MIAVKGAIQDVLQSPHSNTYAQVVRAQSYANQTVPVALSYRACGFIIPCLWLYHTVPVALSYRACGFIIPCLWLYHTVPVALSYRACGFIIPCLWLYHVGLISQMDQDNELSGEWKTECCEPLLFLGDLKVWHIHLAYLALQEGSHWPQDTVCDLKM